jgi:hypothetical protein
MIEQVRLGVELRPGLQTGRVAQVTVRVHESGHHGASREVDDRVARMNLDRAVRDRGDTPVGAEADIAARRDDATVAIDDARIVEAHWARRAWRRLLGRRASRRGHEQQHDDQHGGSTP